MKKELNLECPYKVFADFENQTYTFFTDFNVEYRLSFTDCAYLFNGTLGENMIKDVYNVNIENVSKAFSPKDIKLKETIICILKHFFRNKENSVVYVCDSSDNRELARYRKFNFWFDSEDFSNNLEKLSDTIVIDEITSHYISMIYHKENSLYDILKSSYKEIIDSLKK